MIEIMATYAGKFNYGSQDLPIGATLYGTCDTAAATAAKVATLSNFDYLMTGVTVHIKFANSNTAENPTLKVGSTDAKSIKRYGTTAPGTNSKTSWNAGSIVAFTYDGTYWIMDGWLNDDSNTTYESKSAASGGTDVSLVTTGEKYTWNSKGTYSKPSGGIPASDLASGVIPTVPSAYTSNPAMDGTASAGSSGSWAKGDHVHPTDTSRQAKITASGILKGNGSGGISAATAGTDYGTYSKPSGGIPDSDIASASTWNSKATKPDMATIALSATWSGDGPYMQTVTASGATVTANSKVDLQPTADQIAQLIEDGVQALYIANNNGTLTAYAVGAETSTAMTVQCTVTEVLA